MNYNPYTTQDGSIIHILIIWSKALDFKNYIINDLAQNFEVLKLFKVHWDKELFLKNYFTFYAHSQYKRSREEYEKILLNKIAICGNDDFEVIVIRDNAPVFSKKETSSGIRVVNERVFNKKGEYRNLVGGGHRIHGSDDAWETNKDLTILFGRNTHDFCAKYNIINSSNKHDVPHEEYYSKDCIGVDGFANIEELFYLLNNTIDYVVLRNHECIPEEYTVEGHGDIDLLVENKNYMVYLTGAIPVFRESYRVYHTIVIDGQNIPFDFRYIGDNYYDRAWEIDILESRVKLKNLFYTPNSQHQFYSLLYHAYIQKWQVKDDYIPKLLKYGETVGVDFENSAKHAIELLDLYFEVNDYDYVKPVDKTVVYNELNLALSDRIKKYGQCIKKLYSIPEDPFQYKSFVYEKKDSFVKKGSTFLIDNERQYLEKLSEYNNFPRIITYERKDSHCGVLEISRIKGVDAERFFNCRQNVTISNIRSFLRQACGIIVILVKENIAHRDLLLSNFMIEKRDGEIKVCLIDFGWATSLDKIAIERPKYLGLVRNGNETDFEVFANACNKRLIKMPLTKKVTDTLNSININVMNSQYEFNNKIKILFEQCERPTIIDYAYMLFINTRRLCGKVKKRISKVITF